MLSPLYARKNTILTMELGVPFFIGKLTKEKPHTKAILYLTEFEIKSGRVYWEMETDTGLIFTGNRTWVDIIPKKLSVVLKLPITLHKRPTEFAPEFIFKCSHNTSITSLPFLKKIYGVNIPPMLKLLRKNRGGKL